MARIFGVVIDDKKRVEIGLRSVYGLGQMRAFSICQKLGFKEGLKIGDLTEEELAKITDLVSKNYRVEGDLRSEIAGNIRRLQDVGTLKGRRHKLGLPVRGQQTRTNSRTRKGKRKTVGSGRRVATKPT